MTSKKHQAGWIVALHGQYHFKKKNKARIQLLQAFSVKLHKVGNSLTLPAVKSMQI